MAAVDFEILRARTGPAHLKQRLSRQAYYVARVFSRGLVYFHIENLLWAHWLLKRFLQGTGLYRRGVRNACAVPIEKNVVPFPGLPPALAGFRLLHLSDLHLDANPDFPAVFRRALEGVAHDACVITGDFREKTFGPYDAAMRAFAGLRPALRGPVCAVLGNHDFIEMTADLEALGVTVLLNEAVAIERGNARLWIAGVDDPHFYRTDDLGKTAAAVPAGEPAVLLAHTPEIYRAAEAHGFRLLLAGHTHAGQICLPGGFAILKNARCARQYCRGAWRWGRLQGYTSRGTGSSGVDVRFCCPPEITVHVLQPG